MKRERFAIYAWAVLGYNLLVVAWGAFVRATGSGAGCGDHWPLCNGAVVPRSPGVETMIEFSHRLTSGVALLLVLGMLVWAWRAYPAGNSVRTGAVASSVLILVEALLGAGLVILKLVGVDASSTRVFWMMGHLVNTFLLIGALTLTAWWASGGAPIRLRGQGVVATLLGVGLFAILVVGATGGIAALGDTLFPAQTLEEGLRASFDRASHPLVRLRKLHPLLAVGTGVYLVLASRAVLRLRSDSASQAAAGALSVLVVVQLVAGAINVVLLAPVWLQLVHLLLADLLWIAAVVLAATALAAPPAMARVPDGSPHRDAALR